MTERVKGWALIVVMTTLFAGRALAADDASVLKDLTAASCQDGNRSQGSGTSQGRVVVQKP